MSSKALETLGKRILEDIEKTSKSRTRKFLTRTLTGQLYIVNKRDYLSDIAYYSPVEYLAIEGFLDAVWEEFKLRMSKAGSTLNARRLYELKEEHKQLKEQGLLEPGDEVFYVKTYNQAQRSKSKEKTASIVFKVLETLAPTISTSRETLRSTYAPLGGHSNKEGAQIGHTKGSMGVAASSLRALSVERLIKATIAEGTLAPREAKALEHIVATYRTEVKLGVKHSQVLTSGGNFSKKYVAVLTYQKAETNQSRKNIEQAALNDFFAALTAEEILNTKYTTSLKDATEQVLLQALSPKSAVVQGKKAKTIKEQDTSSNKGSFTRQIEAQRDSSSGMKQAAGTLKGKVPSIASSNTIPKLPELLNALNKNINATVAKNMGSPALNYQTGRFAASVSIEDVYPADSSSAGVVYTYMKYPYQTFEPGYLQGSRDRDPRVLIDKSIREIAAEFAMDIFYTKRV